MSLGTATTNSPSQRAMQFIKNRSNKDERQLKRLLSKVEKERTDRITKVDMDRLEVRDFLKSVKHCPSDELPESKLWLGDKSRRSDVLTSRNIYTAPAGTRNRNAKDGPSSDAAYGTEQERGRPNEQDEMIKFGIFFKKKAELDTKKVHYDIYSRRNMYSSIDRDVKTRDVEEADKIKEEQRQEFLSHQQQQQLEEQKAEEKIKEPEEHAEEEKDEQQPEEDGVLDIRAAIRRIAGVREPSDLEKREARIKMLNSNPPMMKELLVKTARRGAQKRVESAPIEHRIRNFFIKMNEMKQDDDESKSGQPTPEQYRRWILMTKGYEAALAFDDRKEAKKKAQEKESTYD